MSQGLFVAYFTGATGNSLGLFLMKDGVIAGADVGGMKYDGQLSKTADGGWEGTVEIQVPAGGRLINGLTASSDEKLLVSLNLPNQFHRGDSIVRIETPGGPINARFELIREML